MNLSKYFSKPSKKQWMWLGIYTAVLFLGFIAGGFVDKYVVEPNKPYLLVDPNVKAEDCGCKYDYMTYMPIETTGGDIATAEKFTVNTIPIDYIDYVHYPDSWDSKWNIYNPDNEFGARLRLMGQGLVGLLAFGVIVYLIILGRRGKLKKMAEKIKGENGDIS